MLCISLPVLIADLIPLNAAEAIPMAEIGSIKYFALSGK